MRGTITREGILELERAGESIPQVCPYSTIGLECGCWCPKFHEPTTTAYKEILIQICGHDILHLKHLTDLRNLNRAEPCEGEAS